MPANRNKTDKEKLIDSLNRIQGQLAALVERLKHTDLQSPQQTKQINILFKAIQSALASAYDRYRLIYTKKQLESALKQVNDIF